jgi:hypothetical protein
LLETAQRKFVDVFMLFVEVMGFGHPYFLGDWGLGGVINWVWFWNFALVLVLRLINWYAVSAGVCGLGGILALG